MTREKVLKYGITVFNSDLDKFSRWLLKNNLALGGKIPNELLVSEKGVEQVRDCLDKIEYGAFS